MAAIKHAGMVKKYFDPEAEIYICYIDIRAFGKGYEEYFEAVKGMGVKFIRGLPGSVLEDKETGKLRVTGITTKQELRIKAIMYQALLLQPVVPL